MVIFTSKSGAAPLAAWLGHEVIGLHSGGFGYLLGQSVFASTKVMSCILGLSHHIYKKALTTRCTGIGQLSRSTTRVF